MNAPIDEQIKAEAGKSLVERLREKTNLVKFFRYNAQAKHGVPDTNDSDITISPSNVITPVQQTNQKNETESSKTVVQPVVVNNKDEGGEKMKGILQTLVAIASLVAAAWAGNQLFSLNKTPTPEKEVVIQPYQESPYQYLEDIGEHLP